MKYFLKNGHFLCQEHLPNEIQEQQQTQPSVDQTSRCGVCRQETTWSRALYIEETVNS